MNEMDTNCESVQRPKWDVDLLLESLVGQQVRVAARAFCPIGWNGQSMPRWIPADSLVLPDDSVPGVLSVHFEGRLESFVRRIGVVQVTLAAPAGEPRSSDGIVRFRGRTAVIVAAPALVELAFPFVVERLPADTGNYWRDLQVPRAQLEFPW